MLELEDENEAVGSKREGEKEAVLCEVLTIQKESEERHEDADSGFGSRESMVRTSRWHRAYGKAEIEEADGSSSRQGGVGLALFFIERNNLEVEEDSPCPPWQRSSGRKMFGWEDRKESNTGRGGRRSLKCKH